MQGEWKFDPTYWPDPDAMIKELKDMGIELMVSIWPTVDYRSENFNEMKSKGLLIRVDSGYPISMDFQGNTLHYDATNPEAREYVWEKAKKNYYDKGVKVFWLDEAEPEYLGYDYDPMGFQYHRLETYLKKDGELQPLGSVGWEITEEKHPDEEQKN